MTVVDVGIDEAGGHQLFARIDLPVHGALELRADPNDLVVLENNDAIPQQIVAPLVVPDNPTGLDRSSHRIRSLHS
jgi:hypothetical protein